MHVSGETILYLQLAQKYYNSTQILTFLGQMQRKKYAMRQHIRRDKEGKDKDCYNIQKKTIYSLLFHYFNRQEMFCRKRRFVVWFPAG